MENDIFWFEIGSGIWITRQHSPTKNSQEYSPPPGLESEVFRMLKERKDVWVKALKERK